MRSVMYLCYVKRNKRKCAFYCAQDLYCICDIMQYLTLYYIICNLVFARSTVMSYMYYRKGNIH